MSVITQSIGNTFLWFAITAQICLCMISGYFKQLNVAFGTRDNIFMHFGVPAIPFALLQLIMEESKKYLIRNLKEENKGKTHWFKTIFSW